MEIAVYTELILFPLACASQMKDLEWTIWLFMFGMLMLHLYNMTQNDVDQYKYETNLYNLNILYIYFLGIFFVMVAVLMMFVLIMYSMTRDACLLDSIVNGIMNPDNHKKTNEKALTNRFALYNTALQIPYQVMQTFAYTISYLLLNTTGIVCYHGKWCNISYLY
jgi:hypothetical protein